MAKFLYKATRKNGESYEGHTEAPDRFAVYDHIRKEGGTVVSIEEEKEHSLSSLVETATQFTGTIRESDKIMLARNLSTMVKAGLALTRGLSVIERQTTNKRLKVVLTKLTSDVSQGSTLNDALKEFPKVFSPLFVSMVRAGEESGRLAESLGVVASQMERSYYLKKKIRGALIYPAIIVIAMILIGILMLIYVVPTLTQTFEELGVELPASTKAIIVTSDFLTDNSILALAGLALLAALLVVAFRTKRGQRVLDFTILHLPLIAPISKEVNAARTARTLASLLSAGVSMVTAISITKDVMQNSYFKDVLARSERDVQQGVPLSKPFSENAKLYPVLLSEMVAVGEETGQLSEMLEQVASFYESEVEQQTKDLSTVIEPFLMLIIGAVVGFFAISMISPIYSLSGGI